MNDEPLPQGMVRDGTGRRFLVEHAGVWDSSPRGDRVTVYYEDEIRPGDAPPLYRLRPDRSLDWQDETADHRPWLRRIVRVLIAAADAWPRRAARLARRRSMVTHSPLVVSDGLGREFPITRGARPGRRPMAMFPRRWRRFVRGQPPMVARWLRWTQTCRDLADAREAEAEQLARSMISELRAS